jgi:alkylation response protein AidB-like acyl-CoA dehydrogenase
MIVMRDERDMNALSDEAFRAELRGWIEANYPPEKRYLPRRPLPPEIMDWFMTLSRKGWLAPVWPREHGGMGLSASKHLIYVEEMERHGCARLPDHAILMLGPLLIRFGTEEQRREQLPKILRGERIWCQGYSEPNAGSDLASLRTEAVLDGDSYVVNGQKIWTTLGHCADWTFMLVRTDRTAKRKQDGISFLMVDLRSPGVVVRPITNIKGENEYCEMFFTDVRVPVGNLIGEENQGWSLSRALLGHERIFLGNPRQPSYALNRLGALARACGAMGDPAFVDRFTQLQLDVHDLSAAYEEFADVLRAGAEIGPDVSFLKVWATETYQRICDQMLELAGDHGMLRHDVVVDGVQVDVMNQYMESRPPTIYGGSNEIQRNILAKFVLNLPSR